MILITGASSGLGAALAQAYDHDDIHIKISGRSESKLAQVTGALSDKVTSQSADLCNPDSVSQLFDVLPETPSHIIHCAGSGYFGPLEQQEPEAIKSLIDNNLTSSMFLLREAVRRYKEKPVTLVVVMSTAAQVAKSGESSYCAVKWAVKGLVESLRLELKGQPMKIVAVYPGGMATEFWQTSGKSLDTSGFMTATEAATMLKQALVSTEHGFISDITINRG